MATVRHVGAVEAPHGLGSRDHACWCYDDDGTYLRDVVTYLADGAAGGDRLWLLGDRPRTALVRDLASLPGRDAMLASGQLEVSTLTDALDPEADLDLPASLATCSRLVDTALAAGYRGLRLCVDVTPLAVNGHAGRLPCYELAVDRLISTTALSLLCGYDERRVPDLDVIRAVHPLQAHRPGAADFALYPTEGTQAGFRLTGEADLATADLLAAALRAAAEASTGPLELDLSYLQFIDCAATRVLAQFALAQHVTADRPVQLTAPRGEVALCLELFDLGPLVLG